MTNMDKKSWVRGALCIFFVSVFLFVPVSRAQKSQPVWQRHLDYLKNDWSKECLGDLNQLKLLKYTYKGKIKSEDHKSRLIEAVYSDKAPSVSVLSEEVVSDTTFTDADTIIQQKHYPRFEIQTIRQMVDAGKLGENSIAMSKQRLNEHLKIGSEYLELEWSYKGKKFRSLSFVADDGILSDPITSGLRTGGSTIVKTRKSANGK